MDHVAVEESFGVPGVGGGHAAMLTFFDLATTFRYADPCPSKSTDDVFASLQYFMGDTKFDRVYSGNYPSLIKACKDLKILHEPSQQGVPTSNSRIENTNGDLLSGARTCLVHAGFPT